MNKLKLDVDALAVESFAAEPSPAGRATVHARGIVFGDAAVANTLAAGTSPCDPGSDTCPTNPTCPGLGCPTDVTCPGLNTCYGGCTVPECPQPA